MADPRRNPPAPRFVPADQANGGVARRLELGQRRFVYEASALSWTVADVACANQRSRRAALRNFVHQAIQERRAEIAEACRRFSVRRLEVFGSAARGNDFDPARSDADFLVTFEPDAVGSPLKRHLGLAETPEALLARRVDLIDETLEQSRNHFRRRATLASLQPIYG